MRRTAGMIPQAMDAKSYQLQGKGFGPTNQRQYKSREVHPGNNLVVAAVVVFGRGQRNLTAQNRRKSQTGNTVHHGAYSYSQNHKNKADSQV